MSTPSDVKLVIVRAVITRLEGERDALVSAAKAAHEEATHSESKAEDQYDTRGIEASYLAGAQARRAEELERTISWFRTVDPTELRLLQVAVGREGRERAFLVARSGGGITLTVAGRSVQLITPDSPLGEDLSTACVGDEVEVEARGATRAYRVLSVD